jgi:uncharacterized protein
MTPSALIVYGGLASHEPEKTTGLVAGMLGALGFETVQVAELAPLADADYLAGFDLIVLNWSVGTVTDEQVAGLAAAVERGTGFAGWHGGQGVTLEGSHSLMFLTGARFVAHPGGQIRYTVQITDREHPITAGLDDFSLHSEQYYMLVDPSNHVLATTTFGGEHLPWIAGTMMPVTWVRRWGAGRIAYCALGHNAAEFEIPPLREMILRGLLWAARAAH